MVVREGKLDTNPWLKSLSAGERTYPSHISGASKIALDRTRNTGTPEMFTRYAAAVGRRSKKKSPIGDGLQ